MGEAEAPVVVLNGGSSSGKSSIARCLKHLLGPSWLTLGVDDLIRALMGPDPAGSPPEQSGFGAGDGTIGIGPEGTVSVGNAFRRAEATWYAGLAAMGRCGTGLVVDEVFLGGAASQRRLADALTGLPVVWVGVRCDADVAAARERSRPDRVTGMARMQAEQVHAGVRYDLVVDTSATSAADCARTIVAHLAAHGAGHPAVHQQDQP